MQYVLSLTIVRMLFEDVVVEPLLNSRTKRQTRFPYSVGKDGKDTSTPANQPKEAWTMLARCLVSSRFVAGQINHETMMLVTTSEEAPSFP